MPIAPHRYPYGDQAFDFQSGKGWAGVALRENSNTAFVNGSVVGVASTVTESKEVVPPTPHAAAQSPDFDAAVIQLWEGRVLEVDPQTEVMQVLLAAKMGQIPDHTAEIELQWVAEQDRDLVVPGAVFYLTLYKQTSRGSIRNSQELRFRRRPAWTKRQVQKINADADQILAKMRSRPPAA